MNKENLQRQLIRHEGLRLTKYLCPAGHWTIGVGRSMEANPIEDELGRRVDGSGITESEAMVLLQNDIDRCIDEVGRRVPAYERISEQRQSVLIDMSFNMGTGGLLKFKKMLAALERGDFEKAADEMLDSKWARQVGNRSATLAKMMRENVAFA